MTTTTSNEVRRAADDLHNQAQFLYQFEDLLAPLGYDAMSEKMPDAGWDELPWVSVGTYYRTVNIAVHGPDQRANMLLLRRAIGGKWDKDVRASTFRLTREWGNLTIQLEGSREAVCQRVVVGTKTVEHPAVEARPATTETVEEVEWVCGNLLADQEDKS